MEITTYATVEDLVRAAARQVASALRQRPDLVLGLPAGRTPVGTYAELVSLCGAGEADFSRATAFAVDEFVGIDGTHPGSFRRFITEHLAGRVNLPPARFHALNGTAPDLDAECARYDEAIARAGGIGLQMLGIGGNGHVGFNEPARELIAGTHRVRLLEATRRANAAMFGGDETRVPREALTMGIGAILKAETVLLVATGGSKAAIVERMVRGPVTTDVPASLLQGHRSVHVLLDRAAAALL